ncbi:MAG: hypothetical protein QME96_10065 [Myxococcota bacterium]|nr:hypothetical protein [Myxococcota bacterium]
MNEVVLTGLDASNPLAFMAALGVLNVLADRTSGGDEPRLSFRNEGVWRPVVRGADSMGSLVDIALRDLRTWDGDLALGLSYAKSSGTLVSDLKPKPAVFRAYLRGLLDRATPRSVAHAAAFATDVAEDNNGNTKPTALHFTAGQQVFLEMVKTLVRQVTADDIHEALVGPWRYGRELPVLGWDGTASRAYALRARDPSTEKKLGVPGADWLAFRGLSFFRVVPRGRRIQTTCVSGEWKTGLLRWPLWTVPVERATVQTVLALPHGELAGRTETERRARGIGAIFESSIERSDQGGYGSFGPSRAG